MSTFIILLILIIYCIFYFINYYYVQQIENKYQKLNVAVIVEPRKDIMLIKVLKNYLKLLPKNTKIHIFHGIDNEKLILDNFSQEIFHNKIIMTNMKIKNLTIHQYNLLLTSLDFYNKINGENILIFQMDTCLCSNSKYKIQDFLKYDYIGSPWINQNSLKYKNLQKKVISEKIHNKVGNGGLSFRKKSKMIEHIKTHKYNGEPEDIYFSKSKILQFPSITEASNFSTEYLINPYSYGIHRSHKILDNKKLTLLKKTCPEFNMFFEN